MADLPKPACWISQIGLQRYADASVSHVIFSNDTNIDIKIRDRDITIQ